MKKLLLLAMMLVVFSCQKKQALIYVTKDCIKFGYGHVWRVIDNKGNLIGFANSDSINHYINYGIMIDKNTTPLFSNWHFDLSNEDTLVVVIGDIIANSINYKSVILEKYVK